MPDSESQGYEEIAKPFIQQHCLGCHGAAKAKAGYRIDLIGTDFSAATVAEHWKEVIDRINAGEMPPEDRPRPDAKQSAALVTWVNARLREVDLAAKNAGGRIPMRRLNREEYANTLSTPPFLPEWSLDLPGRDHGRDHGSGGCRAGESVLPPKCVSMALNIVAADGGSLSMIVIVAVACEPSVAPPAG